MNSIEKNAYIEMINNLMEQTNDLPLLDLIYKILERSV